MQETPSRTTATRPDPCHFTLDKRPRAFPRQGGIGRHGRARARGPCGAPHSVAEEAGSVPSPAIVIRACNGATMLGTPGGKSDR